MTCRRLRPASPVARVHPEGGTQRLEIHRPRQAQRPRESPPSLGQSKAFGARMHVGAASRKAPPRVGTDGTGAARIRRHRDDSEQQVLGTPLPASDAHAHRDAAGLGDYRQASHTLCYRQSPPAPDRGKIDRFRPNTGGPRLIPQGP